MRREATTPRWRLLVEVLTHTVAASLVGGAVGGCVDRGMAEYTDPLDHLGQSSRRFSSLRLGVVLSDSVPRTMAYLTAERIRHQDSLTKGLNLLLERRFNRVVMLKWMGEARSQSVDLVMLLDTRVSVGTYSGANTQVHVSGRFVDIDGSDIGTISGEGNATVPFPYGNRGFVPAVNAALRAFAANFDGTPKLIAELRRRNDRLAPVPVETTTPPTAVAAVPAADSMPSVPVPGKVSFGAYHALIIGIDNYSALPKLRTGTSDARAVAKLLEDGYGFRVRLLLDATRGAILTAMGTLRQELARGDNLLIYYAGHGWLDREADEGYWLAADATRHSQINWVSNATITSALKAIRAKHILVVADSCYSGKLTRAVHIRPRTKGYLARIARKRARVVLSSGGLEPVADSGGGGHSVFAAAFLQVLKENKGVLDGTALFTHIRRPVMVNSDQTPEYADIRKAGHAGGDFLFVRKKN